MASPRDRGPRRVRYQVASSLDGFIAGPRGESDWLPADPTLDFAKRYARFDTFLMGRRTFESLPPAALSVPGAHTLVFSRTLRQADHPDVEIVPDARERMRALRSEPGKDAWLFGGGTLFRSLLELDEVDSVEVLVAPVLLGGGVPLLPPCAGRRRLRLIRHDCYPSGIALLEYEVERDGHR